MCIKNQHLSFQYHQFQCLFLITKLEPTSQFSIVGYGSVPKVRISQMRIPKDQTSDWVVNFLSLRPSGDIHFTGRGFLLFALK